MCYIHNLRIYGTSALCSVVNWMRARYLMLQGQMDYAMMYLDRVSICGQPIFAQHVDLMLLQQHANMQPEQQSS